MGRFLLKQTASCEEGGRHARWQDVDHLALGEVVPPQPPAQGSAGARLGRAGDHGYEPAAAADLDRPDGGPAPVVSTVPVATSCCPSGWTGRRRLIFMSRAAKSASGSAVVWTAAEEADIPAGRWRPEDRTVLLAQSSAGWHRHGEHRPACLHLKQVDAHQPVDRGPRGSSLRRVGWRISSLDIPRAPGRDGRLESGPILLRRPRSER